MRFYRLVLPVLLALSVVHSGRAAELRTDPVAVLELFTSQGCSASPPADALLAELGKRKDIIALAYHVDYWDYIGWPDTFGDDAHSRYQRAYAQAQGKARIYTPQLMVNGMADVVGSRAGEVEAALAGADLPLEVGLEAGADMLEVEIGPDGALHEATVWLVTYKSGADVAVEGGENRGRTLRYTQIVTGRQVLGMWEPENGAHIKLPLAEILGETSDGAAIIVQEDRAGLPGPILGAAAFALQEARL